MLTAWIVTTRRGSTSTSKYTRRCPTLSSHGAKGLGRRRLRFRFSTVGSQASRRSNASKRAARSRAESPSRWASASRVTSISKRRRVSASVRRSRPRRAHPPLDRHRGQAERHRACCARARPRSLRSATANRGFDLRFSAMAPSKYRPCLSVARPIPAAFYRSASMTASTWTRRAGTSRSTTTQTSSRSRPK